MFYQGKAPNSNLSAQLYNFTQSKAPEGKQLAPMRCNFLLELNATEL
jgi:hypothetical protein